jgi:C4-dicarboxylate-specific signal transduction histidine kinase
MLLQAGLIVALALSRRRLARARNDLRDEHDRRTTAESLAARLRSRLARFSRERSLGAMATAISHEINQPLIAIQNYAQAARRRLEGGTDARAKVAELVAKIEGQARRAGAITERVRSLVGASEPRLQAVAIVPLIEEVIHLMQPEMVERGCELAAPRVIDLAAVLADPLQVQLVMVNLLRNAMQSVTSAPQYDKGVSIDLHRIDDRDVQVSVADRGPGVPSERVAELFERLYTDSAGGMGMGLSIARSIVEAHGGRLWYEPNPGGGAVFRFTLNTASSS